jgi:hypothetical protein
MTIQSEVEKLIDKKLDHISEGLEKLIESRDANVSLVLSILFSGPKKKD